MLAGREQGLACIQVFLPIESQITFFFFLTSFWWRKRSLLLADLAFMLSPCASCERVETPPDKTRADKLSSGSFLSLPLEA